MDAIRISRYIPMNIFNNVKNPMLYAVSLVYCLFQSFAFGMDVMHIANLKQLIMYNSIPVILLLSINFYVNHNKQNNGVFLILYWCMIVFLVRSLI